MPFIRMVFHQEVEQLIAVHVLDDVETEGKTILGHAGSVQHSNINRPIDEFFNDVNDSL